MNKYDYTKHVVNGKPRRRSRAQRNNDLLNVSLACAAVLLLIGFWFANFYK